MFSAETISLKSYLSGTGVAFEPKGFSGLWKKRLTVSLMAFLYALKHGQKELPENVRRILRRWDGPGKRLVEVVVSIHQPR
jgi:hypothetical protein